MPKPLPVPKGFKAAGEVQNVKHLAVEPVFTCYTRLRGRRAEGVRYERKLQVFLQEFYGKFYIPGPWFSFYEVGFGRIRYCQPDGLLFQPYEGLITIVEAKLQHTAAAWWQLRLLYLPVIVKAFGGTRWRFAVCEVTKWYDPGITFPEKPRLRASIADTEPGEIGVHIWRP